MARARAADNARPRSKAVLIDEITRGIEQFQDILTSIEDFSREGFPYRDAARAKAELQLRECVRRIFGERSSEFQTYRNHKLRTSNKTETAHSTSVVKELIRILEDKKLDLQGLKPTPPEPVAPQPPAAAPQMTLVPPTSPTAQVAMAPQAASTSPPMTLSVAMTTNLGMPTHPPAPTTPPPAAHTLTQAHPVIESAAPVTPAPPAPVAFSVQPPPTVTPPPQTSTPVSAPLTPVPTAAAQVPPPSAPSPALVQSPTPTTPSTVATETKSVELATPAAAPEPPTAPQPVPSPPTSPFFAPLNEQDALELIRKVCLRFHAVTRQLRLRKDYRATLEVEDDYDLQDLLCALLRVEFDEVSVDEWTPPYTKGAPRTTFLLHRERIAVVAKKTRPGLTMKELADQVAADSAQYSVRNKCTTLFCFIYDPEGRIGSPKRLETDLTSVSDRYTIEVLVAPK